MGPIPKYSLNAVRSVRSDTLAVVAKSETPLDIYDPEFLTTFGLLPKDLMKLSNTEFADRPVEQSSAATVGVLLGLSPLEEAANDENAQILWQSHRNEVDNIFTLEETKENLKRAINTWKERYAISEKAGRGRYAIVAYDKIKRITIPLKNGHMLFVSVQGDKPANWGDLLKIVDYVEQHPSQQ